MKYYLAYGSNLNLKDMKYRCKNAKLIGTTFLPDYALEFRFYLTVKEKKGSKVPIGIFKIDDKDEIKLDQYEDYPNLYYKKEIDVEFNGQTIKGLIYIMNEDKRKIELPSEEYYFTCFKGYTDCNLDTKYLIDALNDIEEE